MSAPIAHRNYSNAGDAEPSEWIEYLDRKIDFFELCFSPSTLLRNASANLFRGGKQFWVGIDGSCGWGCGHSHPDSIHWPMLEDNLPRHPRVESFWEWMVTSGLQPRFVRYSELNMHSLQIALTIDSHSIQPIIVRGKLAMGAITSAQSRHFDDWLDLFLKQNSIEEANERNRWRREFPIAVWPWNPAMMTQA